MVLFRLEPQASERPYSEGWFGVGVRFVWTLREMVAGMSVVPALSSRQCSGRGRGREPCFPATHPAPVLCQALFGHLVCTVHLIFTTLSGLVGWWTDGPNPAAHLPPLPS